MQLCDYGCGKEAKYQIKKNKYCCSEYISQCPTIREKNSKGNLGKPCIKTYKPKLLNDEIKKICVYGCGQEAKYQFKNGKLCCNDNYSKCPAMIEKMKLARKGTPRKIVFKPIILSEDKKLICDYGCGQQAKYQFHNGKVCCSEKHHKCQHIREKNSKTKKNRKI